MEIKYGRVKLPEFGSELVGYATYEEEGRKVEILSPPYRELIVLENGKRVPTNEVHVLIWTRVAGWLGQEQLLGELNL